MAVVVIAAAVPLAFAFARPQPAPSGPPATTTTAQPAAGRGPGAGDLLGAYRPGRPAHGQGRCEAGARDLRILSTEYASCSVHGPIGPGALRVASTIRGLEDGGTAVIRLQERPGERIDVALSDSHVVVRQLTDGRWHELSSRRLAPRGGPIAWPLTVRVQGSRLRVAIGTTQVSDVRLDEPLQRGRVTFAVAGAGDLRFEGIVVDDAS